MKLLYREFYQKKNITKLEILGTLLKENIRHDIMTVNTDIILINR